ncbi:tetraacyldisaccharide 4'-kinase [Aquabacterium sp. OR-4]|uniref:tetraacyldisaccharide 4'-kinase n=1 Tax=Aquabacterium sp. OR-4 TaxID=2978127 RepID=UPI0021B33661|nr:tetraacyldisaccharide 4'-kinase [Aquabacterium sp. OR-4]MDT7835322.1 tetraacyldisaccharide 4'-kinase [Aquabacterium sp. OR-4]
MRLAAALMRLWVQPQPTLAARLLQPLSVLYGALAALHRWHGRRQARHAPVPVLVVGNLITGGAGKTPTVLALLPRLRALGFTPGVVSRGYGRRDTALREVQRDSPAAAVGDEPLLIHLRSGVPVMVGADRVAAAQALCAAHPELDLLVADDGLQHHRLARQAELWVFDERGAGNGLLLPAGPLRQAVPPVLPAHAAVLYTAPRPSTALPGSCGQRQLGSLRPLADWWQGPDDATARRTPTADGWMQLRGRPVLAAAGLARPEPFFAMLQARGLQITRLPLADHHGFDPLPWDADAELDVIVTEKDAVKLRPGRTGQARVWVAALDFQPDAGFDAALRTLCTRLRPARAAAAAPQPSSAPSR